LSQFDSGQGDARCQGADLAGAGGGPQSRRQRVRPRPRLERLAARGTCGCLLSRRLPVRFWPSRPRCSAVH